MVKRTAAASRDKFPCGDSRMIVVCDIMAAEHKEVGSMWERVKAWWKVAKPKVIVVGLLIGALACGVLYFQQQAQLNVLSETHSKLSVQLSDSDYLTQIRVLEAANATSDLNMKRAARKNHGLVQPGELIFLPESDS